MKQVLLAPALVLAACGGATTPDPEALYFERLSGLCDGQAYAGKLVSDDAVDADFRTASMIMGPATCDGLTVRIPFAVDDDRSRTWVITRTQDGLRLKHDHRHADGSEDVLTQYGGDNTSPGTAGRIFQSMRRPARCSLPRKSKSRRRTPGLWKSNPEKCSPIR